MKTEQHKVLNVTNGTLFSFFLLGMVPVFVGVVIGVFHRQVIAVGEKVSDELTSKAMAATIERPVAPQQPDGPKKTTSGTVTVSKPAPKEEVPKTIDPSYYEVLNRRTLRQRLNPGIYLLPKGGFVELLGHVGMTDVIDYAADKYNARRPPGTPRAQGEATRLCNYPDQPDGTYWDFMPDGVTPRDANVCRFVPPPRPKQKSVQLFNFQRAAPSLLVRLFLLDAMKKECESPDTTFARDIRGSVALAHKEKFSSFGIR